MNTERQKKTFATVLIVGVVGVWLWRSHQPAPHAAAPNLQPSASRTVQAGAAPEIVPNQHSSGEPTEPMAGEVPAIEAKTKPPTIVKSQASKQPPKEPLHDPDARDALALVGVDPLAEQYWVQAIFDTSLPDEEREDLMEDLNEVGFADPKNLTPADLPLIVSRLQIIEQLEPNVDPFMKEHLDEAYVDLSNMYGQVTGQ